MMALVRKNMAVGFDAPCLHEEESSSSSDEDEDGEEKPTHILKRALQLTTRHRLKSLIGDAVQLDRRNAMAQKDLERDTRRIKERRLSKMRGLGRKESGLEKLQLVVKQYIDKPIVKFRRKARAVLLLIQVVQICKKILSDSVKKEPWFALIENLVAKSSSHHKRKGPRPFVTFVPNEKRELVQLTFDVADFKKGKPTERVLTDSVRQIMSILPGNRSPQQVAEIITVLKVLFPNFGNYKLHTQKQIGQLAFYDKYKANRVIVKKGQPPDGLYFVLSGCMVEKHEGGKQPKLINIGEKFGENDLICGTRRRHTVLTKVDSELFYVHSQDYRVIFDVSEDCNNPKNLDICKQHIVFQHFPMARLAENPGTWSVSNYKYGQLIARDLYDLDWIYVIKSGEAKVYKYLQPGNIDVRARRRKVQAQLDAQSPFHHRKRVLDFVQEREYIKSAYRASNYQPPTHSEARLAAYSAPQLPSRSAKTSLLPSRSTARNGIRPHTTGQKTSGSRMESQRNSHSSGKQELVLPQLVLDPDTKVNGNDPENGQDQTDNEGQGDQAECPGPVTLEETVDLDGKRDSVTSHSNNGGGGGGLCVPGEGGGGSGDGTYIPKRVAERRLSVDMQGGLFESGTPAPAHGGRRRSILAPPDEAQAVVRRLSIMQPPQTAPAGATRRGRSGSYVRTPEVKAATPRGAGGAGGAGGASAPRAASGCGRYKLPSWVQVETLHPGQAFGLRACLDPEERGPSVSLVSGDCEVLQINKKFFMRHCDDAIFSLIRLKNKPFPSEEDLIDRLDINMQWEEYKQETLHQFLRQTRSAKR